MNKKLWLILFFILGSLGFYNPIQIMTPQIQKILYYVIFAICLIVAFKTKGKVNYQATPKVAYWLILIGICVATAFVPVYNEQSLSVSIQASLSLFIPYSFLYILLAYNPPVDKIEKMLIYMGLLGIFVNGANMLTAPNCIFGSKQEEIDLSRGFVRVRTPIIFVSFFSMHYLSLKTILQIGRNGCF